jgi:hypothetical protein
VRFSLVRVAFLTVLLAGVVVPTKVWAQGEGGDGDTPAPFCSGGQCRPSGGQELRTAYAHGQAFYIGCGPRSFACPSSLQHVKVTVLKSVAKTLGLSSTTIADGAAAGPSRTNDASIDDTSKSYYFLPLKASVEHKMKKKKVNDIGVTASGSVTGPDGTVYHFKPTLLDWSFEGNCSGRSLHIQRRLSYGGHCTAR